jgi:hypothetical protein
VKLVQNGDFPSKISFQKVSRCAERQCKVKRALGHLPSSTAAFVCEDLLAETIPFIAAITDGRGQPSSEKVDQLIVPHSGSSHGDAIERTTKRRMNRQ